MLESELQSLILSLCRTLGLLVYHTHDSRRSQKGFPDLVIVGAHHHIYRELKTETGKTTAEQQVWLAALTEAGQDAGVWRPADWPQRIQRELQALGRRERPLPSQDELRRHVQRGAKKGPDLT